MVAARLISKKTHIYISSLAPWDKKEFACTFLVTTFVVEGTASFVLVALLGLDYSDQDEYFKCFLNAKGESVFDNKSIPVPAERVLSGSGLRLNFLSITSPSA